MVEPSARGGERGGGDEEGAPLPWTSLRRDGVAGGDKASGTTTPSSSWRRGGGDEEGETAVLGLTSPSSCGNGSLDWSARMDCLSRKTKGKSVVDILIMYSTMPLSSESVMSLTSVPKVGLNEKAWVS